AQGGDGEGEATLAVIGGHGQRGGGTDRDQVEPLGHADVLRDRPPGGNPLQVGRGSGREGDGRGVGQINQGGGRERQEYAAVTPPRRTGRIAEPKCYTFSARRFVLGTS